MDHLTDPRSSVTAGLSEAGLAPSAAELDTLVEAYPAFKEGIESLHAVADARYEAPALVFDPARVFADWAPATA
jgi:hypothetical protein